MKSFASDNTSRVHPKIMESIVNANYDNAKSYGYDEYTLRAENKFKELFGEDIDVYFVYNGTAANVLGLASITNTYNAIICSEWAHINTDECGAPEKNIGCKIISIPSSDGKLNVEDVNKHLFAMGVEHHSQPKVISITQSTELGTVYTKEEIKQIADFAHKNNMYLHMDGARIANAACYLNLGVREFTKDAGVDVLSFGGTKNGMMFGEAVIFLNKGLSEGFKYRRKQYMQLHSKMRYISVQFEALLTDNLYIKNAKNANEMAKYLEVRLREIPNITITQRVEANAVFASLPREVIDKLLEKYYFYIWNEDKNEVRWMTSFDTTKEEIDEFIEDIKKIIK
ncbi:MAG: aromatic amino acid beta-eliminating lyase/threonine aldolase [Caloramator sp.]|jgi:threonine aldolase|uniref:threonine aldolase family protein n=1 Tax=Caloramator sp. TaxID=1871330 RepID=UPI001D6AED90|nr:low specificity L-threonine aldolase [Caloramator sp.]MBZ4662684.1 aromatic amino acid beta-eliminating lyase/threonine aldolase [Caloramator sp.]